MVFLPQAGCCYDPSSRRVVNVEMAKQVVPVVILLLLLLLDGDKALSCFFLPRGMLVKSVPDLLLVLLDGGEPGVKTSILHLLLMLTYGMVVVATSREGHASSLVATRNLLIGLLLVVVKITILPLLTRALVPRTPQMMRSRLLPINMLRMVCLGRSCFIKSCIAGEGDSFWNGVVSTIPRL